MIYKYTKYQKLLRFLIRSRKLIDSQITQSSIAEAAAIQGSYLTRVLNGRSHLNLDQAFAISQFLELSNSERQYFLLLVDFERSTLRARKDELYKKITSLRKKATLTEAQVSMEKTVQANPLESYYLDPIHQLIHLAFSISKYQKNPEALRLDLNLGEDRWKKILTELTRAKLIQPTQTGIKKSPVDTHLSETSPLYRAWRDRVRLMSHAHQLLGQDEAYQFSVFFTAESDSFIEFKDFFFDFLKKTKKQVKSASPESLYQMNFDLHKWL